MGSETLQFETPESLIAKLMEILGSLKANGCVYMDIFLGSGTDSFQWSYNPSDFLNMSKIRDELTNWLPWPDPKQGKSTVIVDGNTNTITVTLR